MTTPSSIAPPEGANHREDSRKAPRLSARLLDSGPLSPKEHQVLARVAEGLSKKQIAARMHRSIKTIDAQVDAVYRKLGAHSATHAVGIAVSRGLLGLTILTLVLAIQMDNKNLIRPKPIRTGRTASARTARRGTGCHGGAATYEQHFIETGHGGGRVVFAARRVVCTASLAAAHAAVPAGGRAAMS